ncbi:hypothetical protein GF359_07245 [candidate division WOR-3 bacterium]|uniref:Lipid-A-disaccharide synthase n=1 Tax=candidate division WOR-3 bacterium TaxID=2052148 RepID=A0A9D5QEF5_UNCW3|nr:hypothetical protein [candidate division WOR-3 bacterium]MBD3364995.1 hypothetical protein [candidate division WOR-3 bacterium]
MHVFISTAERSGLLYARLIADNLARHYPGITIYAPPDADSAPVGFGAGALESRGVLERMRRIERTVRKLRPDVFLAVAWSEPNTILGLRLRDLRGMRRIFFAPPQLWAWGRWRATLIRRGYDTLYCLYPREARFLRSLGLLAHFHRNPLADYLKPYFNLERIPGTIALLPGSRASEKSRNLDLLRGLRIRWKKHQPGFRFTWLFLTDEEARQSRAFIGAGDRIVGGLERYKELAKSGLAVVTSGTATLETALLGTPQVAFYNMSRLEVALVRLLTRVRRFALPNVILDEKVIPEYLNPSAEVLVNAALVQIEAQPFSETLARRLRTELGGSVDKPLIPLNIC